MCLLGTTSCAIITGLDGYDLRDDPASPDGSTADLDASRDGNSDGSAGDDDTGNKDASVVGDGNAEDVIAVDSGPPPACDPTDVSLALCFAFEGSTTDGSGGSAAATAMAVTFGLGQIGQGALFNGVSSGITVPSAPRMDALARATVEAFVRPNALPGPGMRVGVADSSGKFGLFILHDGFRCSHSSQTYVVNTTTPLVIGKVTHIACTEDGATLTAYQDGVPVGSIPAPVLTAGAAATAIGMNEPSGENFNGMLDEARVYSRSRSPAEIAADSARGR